MTLPVRTAAAIGGMLALTHPFAPRLWFRSSWVMTQTVEDDDGFSLTLTLLLAHRLPNDLSRCVPRPELAS